MTKTILRTLKTGTLKTGAVTAVLLLLVSAPALAAAEGGGETNIFAGDVGNVLWTLVIFVLVLFVLGKFAWGPLLDVLQQREDFIKSSLEEAKENREAAESRLRELEERMTQARAEATEIVEEGRRDAEVLRSRIEQEAREEGERMVERAKREIQIARETAIKELYDLSGHLATEIASKIVERELQAKDHQRLIDEAISEIGRAETN